MNSIFKRVSIRKYEEKAVEAEKIELLLKAAMAAPSACNQQPWEFYVVRNKEMIEKLSHTSPYTKLCVGAPLVLVPCYREEGLRCAQFKEIDLSASVENILLEATELGLGAVWMGVAPIEQLIASVKETLGVKEGLSPFCLIAVGYPAEERPQQDRYDVNRVHYVD